MDGDSKTDTMFDSDTSATDKKEAFNELELMRSLQDSLDIDNIDLDLYTVEQCEEEIRRSTVMNTHYRRLMYVIAVNTCMYNYA